MTELGVLRPLPEGWTLGRMKNSVAMSRNGTWGSDPDGEADIRCVRVADFDRAVQRVHDNDVTYRAVSANERQGRVLRRGDLLLEKSGGGEKSPVGFVVLYDRDELAVCSNFVARVVLRTGMDARYWTYVHGANYSGRLTARSIKQSTGIQNLDESNYLNEVVPFPPACEQAWIADFLDRETAEIDAFIADQEELIGLLAERRAATISHAVTKGLDPTVPMKDSGIEWLAKMPSHWVLEKASRLFVARKGLRAAMLTQEYAHDHPGDYPVYSGQTSDGGVLGMIDTFELAAGNQGQLLVTTVGAKAMFLRHIFGEFSLSQNCMTVSSIDKSVATRFYFYLFQTLFGFEKRRIPQHMQASFRMEDFYQYRLPLPPPDEQKAISGHLDAASTEIDATIADAREAITLSKERRAALISAAVTGKIDVREHGVVA